MKKEGVKTETSGDEPADSAAVRAKPEDVTKNNQPARLIRVFISSTFRDMQAERDELAKFIFPQLRKLCERRGATWGEVDLRWGITDEQKSEGKVLPICLDEIQRCRPYFIGLLGERYGWIPDEIPPDLIKQQPWLAEHLDHSVTELEILHGVLNNPEMAEHAFFYFRDPKFIESLPPKERSAYFESTTPEEARRYGSAEAQRRADQRKHKLVDLKGRIRSSGFPVHENYQDPKEFGQWVLKDLTAIIDELYPEGSQPDPLDREAAEHEVFARSRMGVYIGRQTYFDQLEAHAGGDGAPLVVLGESGSGKSALLANWAIRYRREYPDDLVLMHFIGATPASADWASMLRRILGEFKRKFDIREEIPDQPDALRIAFANWLNMAAARGRVVLILDALNQLDDRDGAPDLVWLPPHIPANVRMLLSTLPGRSLDELQKRGWPALTVESLQPEERKQLIQEYLALFTKALSPAQMERIASAAQCQNPLFLRVLLDELRLFGVHEQLSERIEGYLRALTIPALYQLILERCEQDYERERPGLVRDSMALLWAARRGLSEAELMDLLGAGGRPLPRAHWSPLYLALEQSFLSRGGLIGFFHGYLRQAVQNRYLPDRPMQKSAHLRLADYFQAQSGDSPRRLDELPWQLAQAREWPRLSTLLGDFEFLGAAWKFNPIEVKTCWAQVETDSPFRIRDAYRQVVEHPNRYADTVWPISILMRDTGHLTEALALGTYLVDHYRRAGDLANLHASLGNQALILADRGDLDGAMALHKEEERICRQLGDQGGLQRTLGNQALILADRGDLDGAMALIKEQERICRELGNKAGLQFSLGYRALILKDRGDLDGALALHKEQERISRELGDKGRLGISFGSQALILYIRGDLDGALALHKEKEHICRDLGDKAGLGHSLGNQALIHKARGDLDGALALHKEEERICRELGDKAGLSASLGNQALILADRGDLDGAMALHKEEERICRELGNKTGLSHSLNNQALILKYRGDLEGALALHKEQERICRELGDKYELEHSLGNQALILHAHGDLDGAMELHKEEESICRELGDKDGLGRSLGNQAVILNVRGDLDGAMALHKEQECICRELGNMALLQTSLGNQANILYARGDLNGAMAMHKEEERICRKLGNPHGLAISLYNQAIILAKMGKKGEAHRLAEEGLRLAEEHGYRSLVKKIESNKNKL
ncbi:MAG TPA: tetratricopeptide repeat protein [Anaerolineales bacterium]|nr:tetratricopeptide repeat protein [Anaerolineales bacterium]